RKEYSKAEARLTVMVNKELSLQLQRQELEQKFQSATGKKVEDVFPKYPSLSLEEQVQSLRNAPMARYASTKEAIKTVNEVQEPEYMTINESEATNHLNHGFELVTVLPSGKLLIRRKGVN